MQEEEIMQINDFEMNQQADQELSVPELILPWLYGTPPDSILNRINKVHQLSKTLKYSNYDDDRQPRSD
jgi:hypothetical protein